MLIPYAPNDSYSFYGRYYKDQAGGGGVYSGRAIMRGAGFGNLLAKAFRTAMPVLKRAGASLGKQALSAGSAFVGDLLRGDNAKTAIERRAKEGGLGLLDDLVGSSRATKRRRMTPSSTPSARRAARGSPLGKKKKKVSRKRAGRSVVI